MKTLGIIIGVISFIVSAVTLVLLIINIIVGDIATIRRSAIALVLSAPVAIYAIGTVEKMED